MIHVITVLAGQSNQAKIAQQHAVKLAQLFQAKLRIVMIWEPGDNPGSTTWEERTDKEIERIRLETACPDISIERSLRGEGLQKGLLTEARETDLLVVGLPKCEADDDAVCKFIRKQEPSLLRKAECLVLVVHEETKPITNILVDYHGGVEGKAALRIAGELAIRSSAAVTLLCIDQIHENAEMLTASGKCYLGTFGISKITTMALTKESDYDNEIVHAVESSGADFVVLGEQDTFLNSLFGKTVRHPEELSVVLQRPILIAH